MPCNLEAPCMITKWSHRAWEESPLLLLCHLTKTECIRPSKCHQMTTQGRIKRASYWISKLHHLQSDAWPHNVSAKLLTNNVAEWDNLTQWGVLIQTRDIGRHRKRQKMISFPHTTSPWKTWRRRTTTSQSREDSHLRQWMNLNKSKKLSLFSVRSSSSHLTSTSTTLWSLRSSTQVRVIKSPATTKRVASGRMTSSFRTVMGLPIQQTSLVKAGSSRSPSITKRWCQSQCK